MPASEAAPGKGFLGLKNPLPGRPFRAVVAGKRGRFFDALMSLSEYVELYDEEVGCESFRRGIRTETLAPAALAARLEELAARKIFSCLVGHRAFPESFAGRGRFATVVIAPSVEGWDDASLLLGFRAGGLPRAQEAPPLTILSARDIAAGTCPRRLPLPPTGPLLVVIDPLVMDPSLFPVRGNIEPGGLSWYQLTGLLRSLLGEGRVTAALVLPSPLPRSDPGPAFVLAKLTTKLVAYALCGK